MSDQTRPAVFTVASVIVAALIAIALTVGVFEMLLFAAFAAFVAVMATMVAVSLDVRYPEEYQPVRASRREYRDRQ